MNNGKPVTVPAKKQMRITLVNLKLPFLARLWALVSGELVIAVLGTVQEVALVSRDEAHQLMADGYQSKWLPYKTDPASEAPPPLDFKR